MVLAWLSVWREVQPCIWPSWCHCHSLSLAPVKSRLVLPFWYRLTQVVLEKRPLNGSSSNWFSIIWITRYLTRRIMSCYTHKKVIVSWPYSVWRYFALQTVVSMLCRAAGESRSEEGGARCEDDDGRQDQDDVCSSCSSTYARRPATISWQRQYITISRVLQSL